MNCRKVREFVFLYTDNEMDGELLASFRDHVLVCPECAKRTRHAETFVMIVRRKCVRESAPSELRRRILTSLPHRRM
jgi:mycothiol system anti-sigma-R factor